MNNNILVTGAGGFIGSHLTEALVRHGYNVRGLIRYNSMNSWGWLDQSSKDVKANLDVIAGDIRDIDCIRNAMRGCDRVIHLAALISIPYSYSSPVSCVETNVKGTLNVLQAVRELGVQRMVHTSTSEVYGTAKFVPITEEHPLQGQSPYAASKIGADQLAISFYRSFGTPVVILRPFNTYGPRQSSRAVIPAIISQILTGQKMIQLGSTHPTRDFSFVDDTVSGYVAALESTAGDGEVINIGSNFEISIGETLSMIAEIMKADIEVQTDDVRIRPELSEVERLWADNRKAMELTSWRPAYTGRDGLRRGLEETVAWFSQPQNLRRYNPTRYTI